MSQLQITNAGLLYKDQVFAGQEVQNISHFVFANVPGQNETQPIDPNATVPTAHVVKELPVEAVTALDGNAVVISCVMGYDVGDFEFNWYGAIATKANGEKVLIAVVTTATQTKTKTVGTNVGNYSVKSIVWRSQQIAGQLSVTLSSLPWQLNEGSYVSSDEFANHHHDGRYALKEHVLTPVPVNAKFTDTHRAITDSLTSTSSSTSASANAIRIAYSVAVSAQEKANRALLINPVSDTGGSLLKHTKTGIYRIYNAETDLPPGYIANASDFVVTVKGLDGIPSTSVDPTYCKVTVQDVRSSVEWFNTRIAGVWQGWETHSEQHAFLVDGGEITLLPVRKTVVNAWIGSGTINIPAMPRGHEVEIVIHHKGSGIRINTAVGVWLYKDKYNGLSDVVREKGTLIFQSLGDHVRARGIKSK